jgi:hypothetical protein
MSSDNNQESEYPSLEDVAYMLSILVMTICPRAKHKVVHELLIDMFEQDLTEHNMIMYAHAILNSGLSNAKH